VRNAFDTAAISQGGYHHKSIPSRSANRWRRYHRRMADADGKTLDQRLEEIGAQLAWVRDYL
jgi:hypothetical protein